MITLPTNVRRLIDGVNYAHIATVLPDGGPHSVPLWVEMEGDHIAVLTSPKSRKARNLDRDPRVAISMTDHAQPYAMAWVRGRVARRLEDDDALEVIDRLSVKYTGQPYPLRTDRVVFLIEPEHADAVAYG
ncbi:MAG TPA: TIGR03618 family F420-dependent PPOX class oxidoreductase [Candidatus Dormibacteraeota bacterium]|jgi:PPOX class probable F420-dependent enzyme